MFASFKKFHDLMNSARKEIEQLVSLARFGEPVKRNCSVGEFVYEAMLRAEQFAIAQTGGQNLNFSVEIMKEVVRANVDPSQISDAIYEILKNAIECYPNVGAIAIEARRFKNSGKKGIAVLSPGYYLCISIQDDGPGIPPEVAGFVFDPYMTTKPGAKGWGLTKALAAVKGHGGYIVIEDKPHSGALVRLYLPILQDT